MKKDSGNEETVRRQTLTNEEYNELIKTMRKLCSEKNCKNEVELTWRKLTQMFVLVATNSGLRVEEQKQLRWKDIRVEMHKDKDGNTIKLARIVEYVQQLARYGKVGLCCVGMGNTLREYRNYLEKEMKKI